MMTNSNLRLSLVGNLLFGLITCQLIICHQITAAAEHQSNNAASQLVASKQPQQQQQQQSNQTKSNDTNPEVDEILRDTIQLLDSLDERLAVINNKTLSDKHDPEFRMLSVVDNHQATTSTNRSIGSHSDVAATSRLEEAELLSLAQGFSSERRPTSAVHAPSEDPLTVAGSSNEAQAAVSTSKRARQLTDQEQQQQPASLGRFTDNDFTERHIRFSLDLMRAVFASQSYTSKSNVVDSFLISPVSIQMVLMMMHLGARGQTKRELSNSLHLLTTSPVINNSNFNVHSPHKDENKLTLSLANSTANANNSSGNAKLTRRHQQQPPSSPSATSSGGNSGGVKPTTSHHHPQQQQNNLRQTQANSNNNLFHQMQNNNVHEQFGSAMRQLLRDQSVVKALSSANHIFLQRELLLAPHYEWAVKHYYGTDLKLVDFQNQPSGSSGGFNSSSLGAANATQTSQSQSSSSNNIQQLINELVERQTRGKISNFLTSPVPTSTLLMALNVLFFKGDWQYKFDPTDTDPDAWFTQTNGRTVKVPMMVNKLPLAHAHDPVMKTSLIELPYKAQRLGLFILLPDEVNGIFDTMQMLNPSSFANLISMMRKPASGSNSGASSTDTSGGINVRIPKFTIESSPRMTQILSQQLGLKTLFSPDQADLSGMFQQRARSSNTSAKAAEHEAQPSAPIQVGLEELLHKAVLQVHEQGSVAAAASATIVERVGLFNGQYFEADHPFLLFLMDKQTGLVLFSGVFAGPPGGGQDSVGSLADHQSSPASGNGTDSNHLVDRSSKLATSSNGQHPSSS